jgi:hypothetical protein
MTRDELHAFPGFHAPTLLAAVAYLRAELRPVKTVAEPTALIATGSEVNGYLKAIETLIAVTQPKKPEGEKKTFQPYAQPNENPNRPS